MNLDTLHDVILAISQQRSVAAVLQQIVQGITDLPRASTGAAPAASPDLALVRIWLAAPGDVCSSCHFQRECPEKTRCLHLAASDGTSSDGRTRWSQLDGMFRRFPIGVRKIGWIVASGQPVFLQDITAAPEWIARPEWMAAEGIKSFAGHPLIFRGATLGVLGAFSRTPIQPADFERLRSFANHAAVAIANARAFEEIEALRAQLEQENVYLREEVTAALGAADVVGESAGLASVMQQVKVVAPTDATVLLGGESGTGKEIIARAVHDRSPRRDRALVKVNCSAVPEHLFESEFFGHVRGAFTGALKDRVGRFELASGGTLFLDEIGEVPLAMQAKLLRVLQEREMERVGDTRTRKVDARIIAASNRDLKKEVEAGRFRQDLFYRLSVFPIEIPPLRERRADIPLLVAHFAAQFARRMNRPAPHITQASMDRLASRDWPGNVRELQNAVERAVILSGGGPLHFDLAEPRATAGRRAPVSAALEPALLTRDELKRRERESIAGALKESGGKVFGPGGAAELLGMKPTTLTSRIAALGLKRKAGE